MMGWRAFQDWLGAPPERVRIPIEPQPVRRQNGSAWVVLCIAVVFAVAGATCGRWP